MRHLLGPSPSVGLFLTSLTETAFFAFVVAMVVPNIDHMGHLGVSASMKNGFGGHVAFWLRHAYRSSRLTAGLPYVFGANNGNTRADRNLRQGKH